MSDFAEQLKTKRMYRFWLGKVTTMLSLMFLLAGKLQAQDLQILSIDSSAFPLIKAQIVYSGKKKFDSSALKLSQDNRALAYQLNESSPGSAPVNGRALFFLIETSGLLYGTPIIELKEGLMSSLAALQGEDLINAASFGSYEVDSIGFNLLNTEFTTSHKILREAFNTRLSSIADSLQRSDLYHNIIKSLDYISKKSDLPRHKVLIVLSAGKDNGSFGETSAKTINRAQELGLPIHSITILPSDSAYNPGRLDNISKKTGGSFSTCRTRNEIANALTEIFNLPAPDGMRDAYYEVSFTAFNDLNPNAAKIDLNYNGARQIFTAGLPTSDTGISEDYKKYLWISIGILVFVVIIMVVVNVVNKRRPVSELDLNAPDDSFIQERTEKPGTEESMVGPRIQIETVSRPEIIEVKTPKKSGPVLLVSFGGRTNTHSIDRDATKIGRHDTNDIQINEQTVTGSHAVIRKTDTGFELEDLGSTNGTFVNGERIRKRVLISSDRIRFGNIESTVKF
jgi:pSer/pThr/pTyr-binding forkhead associated (FHA) protein